MISRRTFLSRSLGAAAALSSLNTVSAMASGDAPVETPPAPRPVPRSYVLDSLTNDDPFFDPKEALTGGLTAAVVDLRGYPRTFANAIDALADWNDALRRPDSGLFKVLAAADLDEARRQGRFGVILASQDASILDASSGSVNTRNLRNLRFFHDLGLRVLQLTHNERNSIGDSFREKSDAGLSRLGEQVVTEMNRIGMLVDLSHCGDRTTMEAIRLSTKPCAVTHAGCRALQPTLRNKSDEEIRALAERGGYFGVYNMSLWLTRRDTTSIDDVLAHIDHAVQVGGVDLVGFGSDGPVLSDPTPPEERLQGMQGYARRNLGLPGSETIPKHVLVEELNSPRRLQILGDALARRGYKAEDVDKILGANFVRVFREACGS
jgi:membrane dipeptidase